MKNRLYDYICIFFILLEILRPISHAKIVDDTRRTEREISLAQISQPRGNANHVREVNLKREEKDNDFYKDDLTYPREKRKISDVQQSNAEKSVNRIDSPFSLNEASDYAEEQAGEETVKQEGDKDVEMNDLVRLPRDVNAEKYTDQDERSSLYDDYEAKDVAKRGVLDGPGDYEEAEDDPPGILEDTVALEENEEERRETRERSSPDSRVKRDQAISETSDKSESRNPAKLEEPKIAESSLTGKVSRVESSKSFNRRESAPGDPASEIKGFAGSDEVISRSSGSDSKEPSYIISSSNKDESRAECGKRVEEEIQRKIDSIKEEIKRDIEAQQRIRDIEENNARFDELRDQEDEERQGSEGEPIEKRQIKRSIREIAAPSFSKRDDRKRSLNGEQRNNPQRRSSEIDRPDNLKESESLKRQFAINHDKSSEQAPSKGLFKRKRDHVRQIFLVNNDRTKRRSSRSYTLPSDRTAARPENELFTNLNSYHHTNNGMLQASSPIAAEDENNDEEQSPTAEHSNSLVALTGSSQELSPRLAREYKEAFGGLQSEPGGALARFKRIKRVLDGSDAKI